MKLHIKNMVCNRCIIVVKSELEKLGLDYLSVDLGEVTYFKKLKGNKRKEIDLLLKCTNHIHNYTNRSGFSFRNLYY